MYNLHYNNETYGGEVFESKVIVCSWRQCYGN